MIFLLFQFGINESVLLNTIMVWLKKVYSLSLNCILKTDIFLAIKIQLIIKIFNKDTNHSRRSKSK